MESIKNILNEIVKDYGLKILEDSQKFKAVFADYAKGEYSAEKELFTKVIETGAAKEIKNAEDIPTTKKALVKKLHERYFLDENVLDNYLDIFIPLLRSDYTVNNKAKVKEETHITVPSDTTNISTNRFPMKHINSVRNSWSFDVPILFEEIHKNFHD